MFDRELSEGPSVDDINRHVRGDPGLMLALSTSPFGKALLETQDHAVLREFGKMFGIPLSVLLAVKSEMIALMTTGLVRGVPLQAARAYAVYRLHADATQAHARQATFLDPHALSAVVEAKIYTEASEAGAAIWRVMEQLEPVLRAIHDDMPDAEDQPD